MRGFLGSSIGKKMVMAVTGLILFGFVLIHMLGNLQIFLGQDELNDYALHLRRMPWLLWPARVVLLAALAAHVTAAVVLTVENRNARPTPYLYKDTVQASYASRTLMASGILIFLFTVYHLLHYTFGVAHPEFFHLVDSKGRQDVYSMVVHSFRNVYISGVYILAMALLSLHVSHGAASLFQSLGLNNERFEPRLRIFAAAAALAIFLGNSSIPAAVLMDFLRLPGAGV